MSEKIHSMLQENRKFPPPKALSAKAWLKNFDDYKKMYDESIRDPEGFWAKIAEEFWWEKKWNKVRSYDFKNKIEIKWFEGAKTNITVNALDRHVKAGKGHHVALIWEGNEPSQSKKVNYKELLDQVCRFANVLKTKGVKKGERVSIYMPMVPELTVAILACARIGAIHSVIFGGFSADSIKDRMLDAQCHTLITADGGMRGTKNIPLKETCDEAMASCEEAGLHVKTCIVFQWTKQKVTMKKGRDCWWHEEAAKVSTDCPPEIMDAEAPLFILYTSGSTGKPKGVLHTTAGYMVYATATFKYIFDYHPGDVYWCTADVGWVTGHSYIIYGPLCAGATTLMFEGVPNYPQPDRFWRVIEKYKVNVFYTAPTAIRALMKEGDTWPNQCDLSSLKILGTVGEPINPEAWMWYHRVIGKEKCPIVDTWWQTETGGILITPLPGVTATKPGSATFPFFGVKPAIYKEDRSKAGVNEGGYLVIEEAWPGMMRTVYGAHERFKETYFSKFPGVYLTGDSARCDEEGYFWLMGRIDDVLNVAGHRIGTAEVESALVSHEAVAESAVVGYPHEIKGQGIYAYVTLKSGVKSNGNNLKEALIKHVRKEIGPIATPDKIHFAPALPKTRSGKIMRRILRKIAAGETKDLGDTTTLADPSVVDSLLSTRV